MTARRRLLVLALVVLLCVTSIACQRQTETTSTQPTVALVLKTLNNPFFIDMQKGAQQAAAQAGLRLTVQAAEREVDVEKQMQIIENLIQSKVSALCVTPSGSRDRKSTRLNSSHLGISYAVFCLK